MDKRSHVIACFLFLSALANAEMLLDDGETGLKWNNAGGAWLRFSDAFSSTVFTGDFKPGYAGSAYCRKLAWQLKAGAPAPFAGAETALKPDLSSMKLRAYCGVRFYARGSGAYRVSLPIDATRVEFNHYGIDIQVGQQWQLYEIAFFTLRQAGGTLREWDPDTVYAVAFQARGAAGASGELYVDDIEFFSKAEVKDKSTVNPVMPAPKTNQLGYLPDADKYFSLTAESAAAGSAFDIIDEGTGKSVYSGIIPGPPIDDTAEAGESVYRVDFSTLTAPGTYRVSVKGLKSHAFKVTEEIYDELFRDALRCFYVIRCGTDVSDAVSGVKHPACHLSIKAADSPGRTIKASGGWHNAGDFGKWTIEAALSASYMMRLYEVKTRYLEGLKVNIPESGNNVSDLLDEARWGLAWLLKMQRPDGSVYHKVDTQPDFCFGTPPEKDPYTSYASFQSRTRPQAPSSIDAGALAAVMAQAYRVFRNIDPPFALDCKNAALRSWGWITSHPAVGQTDPYYTDPDPSQEVRWAKAEMFCLTGDAGLEKQLQAEMSGEPFPPLSWMNPQALGYFSLFFDARTNAALKTIIKTKLKDYCDALAASAGKSGYGAAAEASEYYWESNEVLLHKAACLLFCFLATGTDAYRKLALNQLDYLLGTNSLDQSYVTGYGERRNARPYHWTRAAYGALMPGWVSGGPNGYPDGADSLLTAMITCGLPPAKCWLDLCGPTGSWASNEGETSENAALVFLTGFFAAR